MHCLCRFRLTGRKFHVINFGSYNYLGFSELNNEVMQDNLDILEKYGLGVCAGRQELGQLYCLFFLMCCVMFCVFVVMVAGSLLRLLPIHVSSYL